LPPLSHSDAIIEAAFSADEKFVVTAGLDLRLRIWAISSTEYSFAEADRKSRLFSGHAVDSSGTLIALPPAEIFELWTKGRIGRAAKTEKN
jgi:hypothetical protein